MRREDELSAINAIAAGAHSRPPQAFRLPRILTGHKINVVVKPSKLSVVRETVRHSVGRKQMPVLRAVMSDANNG